MFLVQLTRQRISSRVASRCEELRNWIYWPFLAAFLYTDDCAVPCTQRLRQTSTNISTIRHRVPGSLIGPVAKAEDLSNPWQIRVTSVNHIPPTHNFNLYVFRQHTPTHTHKITPQTRTQLWTYFDQWNCNLSSALSFVFNDIYCYLMVWLWITLVLNVLGGIIR